jgi:Universal stress protein family
VQEVDDASKTHADRVAEDGAALAKSLGLQAEPLAVADEGNVADAIVELAHNRGVAAIVVGSRGLSGLRARLEGSTSNAVAKHSTVPSRPGSRRLRAIAGEYEGAPRQQPLWTKSGASHGRQRSRLPERLTYPSCRRYLRLHNTGDRSHQRELERRASDAGARRRPRRPALPFLLELIASTTRLRR